MQHIRERINLGRFWMPRTSPTVTATVSPTTTSTTTATVYPTRETLLQSGPKLQPAIVPSGTTAPLVDPTFEPSLVPSGTFDTSIPETFRYSKEQLADMLMRGQTETFERSGEDENGLPFATELEQQSREMDATKQFGIDAGDNVLPEMAPEPTGQGMGLILAAIAGYFLLGG